MPSYFILGSCVTRDIFSIMKDPSPITYYARSSLISIMGNPIPVEEEMLQLDSAFQRRMVLQDFQKTIFDDLSTLKFDYFIMDFIDERFDLFQIGDSYVTRSVELVNSKVMESAFKNHLLVKRHSN